MPEVYDELGNGDRKAGFDAMNAMSYGEAVEHASSSIACIDCHDGADDHPSGIHGGH